MLFITVNRLDTLENKSLKIYLAKKIDNNKNIRKYLKSIYQTHCSLVFTRNTLIAFEYIIIVINYSIFFVFS